MNHLQVWASGWCAAFALSAALAPRPDWSGAALMAGFSILNAWMGAVFYRPEPPRIVVSDGSDLTRRLRERCADDAREERSA